MGNRIFFIIVLLSLITRNVYSGVDDSTYTDLQTGLAAYYPFNGNAADSSINGNHGEVINAVLTEDRFGNDSSAYYLNGINAYIAIANSPTMNPENEISICAWYKTTEFNGLGYSPIIDKGFTSHTNPYYQYKMGVGGNYSDLRSFAFSVTTDSIRHNVATEKQYWETDKWYFLVGTYDGNVMKFYVNNSLIDSISVSGMISTFDTPIYLGNNTTEDDFLAGVIDDIRIYDRALNTDEISELFKMGGWEIEEKFLIVTSPNGGENWISDSENEILWISDNVENVMIEYSTSNDSNWVTIVDSLPANTGSYLWTVPYEKSDECRIRITDISDSLIYDLSDSLFTILPDLNSGLVAYYPFNGNAADSSINGNHGEVINAVLTEDRFGNDSSAYYLNGVDAYIAIANSPTMNPENEISICAWYKTTEFNGLGYSPIIDKGFTSHTNPYYQYKMGVGGNYSDLRSFAFSVTTDSILNNVSTGTQFWETDSWYFITGIYDGQSMKLYVNNNLTDSIPVTGTISNFDSPVYLGNNTTADDFLTGVIDDIRIYNRALNPLEIRELYNEENEIVLSVDEKIETPTEYALIQNYPNPFNPSTKINYQLPMNSNVNLTIYNLIGQKVATLVNKEQPAGSYEVKFDASSLSSGIYIYRIEAGEFSASKKMLLLK